MYPLFKVGLEKKPFQVYTQRIVPVNLPSVQETQVRSLGREDPLEKERLPSPIFWPGEFHGQRILAGYSPWGLRV